MAGIDVRHQTRDMAPGRDAVYPQPAGSDNATVPQTLRARPGDGDGAESLPARGGARHSEGDCTGRAQPLSTGA